MNAFIFVNLTSHKTITYASQKFSHLQVTIEVEYFWLEQTDVSTNVYGHIKVKCGDGIGGTTVARLELR